MGKKKDSPKDSIRIFTGRVIHKLMLFLTLLLKALYLLPFLLFGLWLLQLLYFPQLMAKNIFSLNKIRGIEVTESNQIQRQEGTAPREHFHMVDDHVFQPDTKPPLCLRCHGTYPHSKEEKVRSLLNFHTGYMACSVCHGRIEPGDKDVIFSWIDQETGEPVLTVKGEYGKYSGKIFPIQITAEGQKKIFRPVDEKMAQKYLSAVQDEYSPDQIAVVKIKLHEHISTKPIACSDCHKRDGYLDFTKLGFPLRRVNHLNSSEVVGMIEKYKTFYIPSEIDFGAQKTFN